MGYTIGDTPDFVSMTEITTGVKPTFVQPGVIVDPAPATIVACWDGSQASSVDQCPPYTAGPSSPSSSSGDNTMTYVLIGGVVLLGIALLKKKRRKAR